MVGGRATLRQGEADLRFRKAINVRSSGVRVARDAEDRKWRAGPCLTRLRRRVARGAGGQAVAVVAAAEAAQAVRAKAVVLRVAVAAVVAAEAVV